MNNIECEGEAPLAQFGMRYGESAGRKPRWQVKADPADAEEVAGAAEQKRCVFDMDSQFHADAAADIFFKAGGAGEAL